MNKVIVHLSSNIYLKCIKNIINMEYFKILIIFLHLIKDLHYKIWEFGKAPKKIETGSNK